MERERDPMDCIPDRMAVQSSLEFAMVEPARVHEPVFRPIKRGDRDQNFDITREIDNLNLRILGPKLLGEDDADLYFTILALLGKKNRGKLIDAEVEDEIGRAVWDDLEAKANAKGEHTLSARTTFYELLKELGRDPDGSNQYAWMRESLTRMNATTIHVEEPISTGNKKRWSMNMIGYAEEEGDDHDALVLSIDARAAQAILPDGLAHRKVDLDERRALESDRAKSLHKWLSGWMNRGEERPIEIDNLAKRIWRDFEDLSTSGQRSRRSRAKDALAELEERIGYKYKIRGNGGDAMVTIQRPEKINPNKLPM